MCNCKLSKTMPCDVESDITDQPHSPCVHIKTILLALDHFLKKAQYLNAQQLKWGGALKLRKSLCICTLLRPLLLESPTVIKINRFPPTRKKTFEICSIYV